MLPGGKKIAIYARKSKFTGKGDSIESQIALCKNKIYEKYEGISDDDIDIFSEEGVSGASTRKRKQFQAMMKNVVEGKYECVVTYKLDRFSRSTSDFFTNFDIIKNNKVTFISVSDTFDTSTSNGQIFMGMMVMFSEFERNIITERITDNMLYLAKGGRWLGGTCPTGYRSVKLSGDTKNDGHIRTQHKLEIIPEEAEIVKLIFDKYLELKSMTALETYCIQHDIKTKNDVAYSRFAIKGILSNPVYVSGDESIFDYFDSIGAKIFTEKADFDGKHGVMVYNKTNQNITPDKNYRIKPTSEWIVAIGKHKPIIDSAKWLEVQNLLSQNNSKSYRQTKSNDAILSGLLICGECGAYMRPKTDHRRKTPEGKSRFSYTCEGKAKSKKHLCSIKAINQGNDLDNEVINYISSIAQNREDIFNDVKKTAKAVLENKDNYEKELKSLKRAQNKLKKEIDAAMLNFKKLTSEVTIKLLEKDIEDMTKRESEIAKQITEIEEKLANSKLSLSYFDNYINEYASFSKNFSTMSAIDKNHMLRTFIDRIIWDGEKFDIILAGGTIDSGATLCEDSK